MWRTLDSNGRLKSIGATGPTGPTSMTPRCSAFNSTGQSSITALVALTLDSEDFDTSGMHSTGSNTSRITVAASGTYWIHGRTTVTPTTATGTPLISMGLYKNSAASGTLLDTASVAVVNIQQNLPFAIFVTGLFVLAANDYVEIYGSSTNAATFGGVTGNANRLQVAQVG